MKRNESTLTMLRQEYVKVIQAYITLIGILDSQSFIVKAGGDFDER